MYLGLLVLGLVVAAIGLVTVGFGIPINAFSIGNTLIIAGSVLVAAGLVLIGLAIVVQQLQRVASLLTVRPAKVTEPAEVVVAPSAKPMSAPPVSARPAEAEIARPAEPRAPEPRVPMPEVVEPQSSDAAPTPPPSPPKKSPLDWLRPKSKASAESPPMVEVTDEAPLSPRPTRNGGTPSETGDPKAWAAARDEAPSEPPSERTTRATPPSERPKDTGLFDVVWPDPKSAPPSDTARREPAGPRANPTPERRATASAVPAPERTPAILKSGVIDGMAYTLYADGSIEAELPQGTLNFASVDELRAHLEKHGG